MIERKGTNYIVHVSMCLFECGGPELCPKIDSPPPLLACLADVGLCDLPALISSVVGKEPSVGK